MQGGQRSARNKLAFHHHRLWLGLVEGVWICLKKLFVQHYEFCVFVGRNGTGIVFLSQLADTHVVGRSACRAAGIGSGATARNVFELPELIETSLRIVGIIPNEITSPLDEHCVLNVAGGVFDPIPGRHLFRRFAQSSPRSGSHRASRRGRSTRPPSGFPGIVRSPRSHT